jgi:hypothetical protein
MKKSKYYHRLQRQKQRLVQCADCKQWFPRDQVCDNWAQADFYGRDVEYYCFECFEENEHWDY